RACRAGSDLPRPRRRIRALARDARVPATGEPLGAPRHRRSFARSRRARALGRSRPRDAAGAARCATGRGNLRRSARRARARARVRLFPFVALVGLDTLKLALQLAAIDSRLSVLVRGDKGAGKTTAARGLAALLAPGARFVTLPIGATEDRLLGGLDLERALKGEPALKPGVLADAHGGVLYIDEVNLLPDHLADALLDASASGLHIV